MADATLKKLIALINSPERPELRRAAVLVAGETANSKDKSLPKALLDALHEDDPGLRALVLDALGKLRVEQALPKLVELVRAGSHELEAAARAAGHLGARGARAMEKLMGEVPTALRRRIASALALGGTESAAVAAAHALLDEDPGVVDAAARSLGAELPLLSPAHRRALADQLLNALKTKRKPALAPASEAAMLRVLAAMEDARAEELLWSRVDAARPAAVRAAAQHALGVLPPPRREARFRLLLEAAADPDFQVAAPALLILKQVPASPTNARDWLKLLQAPDAATRRFAVEKLSRLDRPEIAKALAGQLNHADRALRDETLRALSNLKHGRTALVEALLAAQSPEEAWTLARTQAPWAKELPDRARTRVFDLACSYREKEDRRADPLFFLLREIDADWTANQIQERGLALRKKRNYLGALAYFKLLARDPACSEASRFELAATGLKTSERDVSPEARHADPALTQFGRLLQNPAFDVLGRLKKLKWLEPEDLFYLGFHFAERNHREKEFGRDVLELLIQRSPRSTLAKDARRKLKSEALT